MTCSVILVVFAIPGKKKKQVEKEPAIETEVSFHSKPESEEKASTQEVPKSDKVIRLLIYIVIESPLSEAEVNPVCHSVWFLQQN